MLETRMAHPSGSLFRARGSRSLPCTETHPLLQDMAVGVAVGQKRKMPVVDHPQMKRDRLPGPGLPGERPWFAASIVKHLQRSYDTANDLYTFSEAFYDIWPQNSWESARG